MKPMFNRGPALRVRLVVAVVASVALLAADRYFPYAEQLRFGVAALGSPLQHLANSPRDLLDYLYEQLASRQRLIAENEELRRQHLLNSEQLQLFAQLRQENNRLRRLLGSVERADVRKAVAEVFAVTSDPFRLQLVIDKGRFDGVYEGQPVLDERGIVGQVVAVGPTTSRVLLIADDMHAIPVRIYRNDVRAIAVGSGELDRLTLQYLPHSTDVRVGDLLVASGLGGRFPEGYPVARVTHVDRNERSSFARVDAVPEASLDRLRYLLLLWPQLRDETGQPLPAAAPAATTPTAPEVKP